MTSPTATTVTTTPLTPTESGVRGRFLWHDLITSDVDGATEFYTAVTGWTLQRMATIAGQPPYTMWVNAAGEPVGGVTALPADARLRGATPYWMTHVGTPDARATHDEAVAAGGTSLQPPTSIPGIGVYAVLADPQCATFAIYEPEMALPAPATPPAVGSFVWHELATTSREAALDFYARLFGWERTGDHDMGPIGTYSLIGRGRESYGGVYTPPDAVAPPAWLVYVFVDDLERAAAAVGEHGGEVMFGPDEVPGGGRVAICRDPQGAMFAMHVSGAAGATG